MKKLIAIALISMLAFANDGFAKGSFSSSGGRGGFSSSSRSFPSSRTSATTTRTVTRTSYFGGRNYSSYHYGYGMGWHPFMFGGPWGMGYMYSDGLMEGIIIGSLMHPAGTVVYNGGGYSQPALLYPDGAVVNQQGQQIGMYQNNQFTPVQNGQMLAQPAPQQPQPIFVQKPSKTSGFDTIFEVIGLLFVIFIVAFVVISKL